MQPPVALLVYAPDEPQRAAFFPFTHFSPEWQALRYAFGRRVPGALHRPAPGDQLADEQHRRGTARRRKEQGTAAEPAAPTGTPDSTD